MGRHQFTVEFLKLCLDSGEKQPFLSCVVEPEAAVVSRAFLQSQEFIFLCLATLEHESVIQ